jgi:predicted nucleotidyltransferase
MEPDPKLVAQLVTAIADAVQPIQIVLFGSAARGQMSHDSDIDLLVVMPDGTHRRHTAQYLYQTINGVKTSFDLVVATPSDLAKHKDNIGLIYRTILREGKMVYAQPVA